MLSLLKKLKPKNKENLQGVLTPNTDMSLGKQTIKYLKKRLNDRSLPKEEREQAKKDYEKAVAQDKSTKKVITKSEYGASTYKGLQSVSIVKEGLDNDNDDDDDFFASDNNYNTNTQNNNDDSYEGVYTPEEFIALLTDLEVEIKTAIDELNSKDINPDKRKELNKLCQSMFKKHNRIKSSKFNWS